MDGYSDKSGACSNSIESPLPMTMMTTPSSPLTASADDTIMQPPTMTTKHIQQDQTMPTAGQTSSAVIRTRKRRRLLPIMTTRQTAALFLFLLSTLLTGRASGNNGNGNGNNNGNNNWNTNPLPCEDRNYGQCEKNAQGNSGELECRWQNEKCTTRPVSPVDSGSTITLDSGSTITLSESDINLVGGTGATLSPFPTTNFSWPGTNVPLDPAPTAVPAVTPSPTSGAPVTQGPSRGPTPRPTQATPPPTPQPTKRPTRVPTKRPTMMPTEEPSAEPSEDPTASPTDVPTERPTVRPSRSPSVSPTLSPSASPTRGPSASPTASPSEAPTESPTENPTESPTDSPTGSPTGWPSLSPTISARPTPLIWPSASPSISSEPSASPTDFPTDSPTVSPTDDPTSSPSGSPTNSPTSSPTESPTASPNLEPTTSRPTEEGVDTNNPTMQPTPPPTMKPTVPNNSEEVPSEMELDGLTDELDEDGMRAWTEETENRIREYTARIIGDNGKGLVVSVDEVEQSMMQGQIFKRKLLRSHDDMTLTSVYADGDMHHGHLRKLQTYQLQISFVTRIQFNSDSNDWDFDDMVSAGFRTPEHQEEYIISLKDADDASFNNVNSMSMKVNGEVITDEGIDSQPMEPVEKKDPTMYYIIGGSVAGGLLLLIAGGMFYKRSKSSSSASSQPHKSVPSQDMPSSSHPGSYHQSPPPPLPIMSTSATPPPQSYFGTIESREGEDDVSTLGDPYFGENPTEPPRADDTVTGSMMSSEQGMYEFGINRERLNTGGASTLMTSTMNGSNPNVFRDDATYEDVYRTPNGYEGSSNYQRVTVIAPAGKLGIVVDNQTGDMPVVHAIKETSVLNGKVHVGDYLLSVDEIDCRGLSAVQVSRLISSRRQSAVRTLVLQRGSGGC